MTETFSGKITKLENINSQFQNLPQGFSVQTEGHQYGVDLKSSEDSWDPHACRQLIFSRNIRCLLCKQEDWGSTP